MHHVPKSTEPSALKSVRVKHTPRWVDYYKRGTGNKPTDSHWRGFSRSLSKEFHGLCAYCEQECKGEVDHFRPKSRFPDRVYRWDNWVLACHDCNLAKSEKWPKTGYVFSCDPSLGQRPEDYFTFDTMTGEILPMPHLGKRDTAKAWQMIQDLNLRGSHHMKSRLRFLRVVEETVAAAQDKTRLKPFFELVTSRRSPHSSIVRLYLQEKGLFNAT